VHEKLIVIYYSELAQNNKTIARRFDIEMKQVHDWKSKKQELLNTIETLHNKQIAISRKKVVIRAKQLAQTNEIKDAYPNI
ncbi:22831_t:CDS:2, partial [Gigaspora margarita]